MTFITGGILCAIAQILIDKTNLSPARILVTYVCAGIFMTSIGFYGRLVNVASCGATVPLTGFGYALAQGVKEAVDSIGFLGVFVGGLSGCSGGIAAAIVFSLIFSVFFKGKPENL